MTDKERLLKTYRYEKVDRRPLHLVGAWPDTLARWRKEGLPENVKDIHEYLGVKPLRLMNVTGIAGIYPPFEQKILKEDAETIAKIDSCGRTVLDFKHHTTMPEWLDFPVKSGSDLRRVMDEHFNVSDLDARFDADWKERVRRAKEEDCVVLLDGGCFYSTLRRHQRCRAMRGGGEHGTRSPQAPVRTGTAPHRRLRQADRRPGQESDRCGIRKIEAGD